MIDRGLLVFLGLGIFALAASLLVGQRQAPVSVVSEEGIIPSKLLRQLAHEDELLNRPVNWLDGCETTLETIVGKLAVESKTDIEPNWKTLEECGVDRSTPVRLKPRQCTLYNALSLVISYAGGGTAKLSFAVEGEKIEISSEDELERKHETQIYNIRPLIDRLCLANPRGAKGLNTPQAAADAIVRAVTLVVAHDAWDSIEPKIHEMGGLLFVTDFHDTHRKVAAVLAELDANIGR